jgi:hypothetical protein
LGYYRLSAFATGPKQKLGSYSEKEKEENNVEPKPKLFLCITREIDSDFYHLR